MVRPNIEHVGSNAPLSDVQRMSYPNVDSTAPLTGPVYNAHTRIAWSYLPSLRPPALYLLGAGSQLSPVDELEKRTSITGTGPGGSGGRIAARVASVTIPGGHFLPMTNIEGTAEAISNWLGHEIRLYRAREDEFNNLWGGKTVSEKQRLDERTERTLRAWDGRPWPKPNAMPIKCRM